MTAAPRAHAPAPVAAAPADAATTVRPAVAILVSRFPKITETFILRELIELERRGQPVRLVPLIEERPAVVHPEARRWVERALVTPWLSPAIAAANLRALRRRPGRWLGLAARLVAGTAARSGLLARTLALYPKAVYLAERLGREGVRHVHAHFATHPTTAALVIERFAGIPFSFTAHAHDIFVDHHLLRWKLAAARFVRAISRFNRDYLLALEPGSAARVEVVPVGVEPERYAPPAAFAPAGGTARAVGAGPPPAPAPPGGGEPPPAPAVAPVVLSIAALEPYKGLPALIEACRRLAAAGTAFSCEVIGDGRARRRLERRIAAAGLAGRVRLLGARPQQEVAERLRCAAVVVQPSVVARNGQMDGIPVALIEALAAGRPVVASALSGVPELVEDGVSGLLVPPGDPAALAAAVGRLLADPALAAALGGRGRRRVEADFRLDRSVDRLLARLDRETGAASPPGWPASAAGDRPAARRGGERGRGGDARAGPLPAAAAELVAIARAAGAVDGPVGVRRLHERPDSRVAELLVAGPDGPRELVVKQQRSRPGESRPPAARARREHGVLVQLESALAAEADGGERGELGRGPVAGSDPGARCAVPRPLHLDAVRAAVVMAACAGRPLDELIRRWRGRRGDAATLAAAVRAAGAWLGRFQAVTAAPGPAREELEALLAAGTAAARACAERGFLRSAAAERIAGRLAELAAAVSPAGLRRSGRHGDFWPGNVFVAGDRVEVIDFEGFGTGLPAEDAAGFLVHLRLFFRPPARRRAGLALAAAFAAGWTGAGGAPDRAALALARAEAALRLLARAPAGLGAYGRRRALAAEVGRALA